MFDSLDKEVFEEGNILKKDLVFDKSCSYSVSNIINKECLLEEIYRVLEEREIKKK